MTAESNKQDSITDGMAKLAEATRHSMTASRLAMAGMVALGAAGSVYFLDPERREAFMRSMSRWTEGLTPWWGSSASEPGSGSTKAAEPKAATEDTPMSNGSDNVPPGAHSG
jgi:hypothetical protein